MAETRTKSTFHALCEASNGISGTMAVECHALLPLYHDGFYMFLRNLTLRKIETSMYQRNQQNHPQQLGKFWSQASREFTVNWVYALSWFFHALFSPQFDGQNVCKIVIPSRTKEDPTYQRRMDRKLKWLPTFYLEISWRIVLSPLPDATAFGATLKEHWTWISKAHQAMKGWRSPATSCNHQYWPQAILWQ